MKKLNTTDKQATKAPRVGEIRTKQLEQVRGGMTKGNIPCCW